MRETYPLNVGLWGGPVFPGETVSLKWRQEGNRGMRHQHLTLTEVFF